MNQITPVILCGGSGTRLWPRSRKVRPKPFLPLVGEQTLFQATLERCGDRDLFAAPIVVTGAAHLDLVRSQIAPDEGTRIVIEPEGRNTAPAIALAAASLPHDAVMLVCPSDHHIADRSAFVIAARKASELALSGKMVAFGIQPTAPETGYGYICRGKALGEGFEIERFIEKPDIDTALTFLADGRYSWNGGIFAFTAGAYLAELERHRPAMAAAIQRAVEVGEWESDEFRPAKEPFCEVAGESVDYALMENTERAAMIPVDMGWSDIGSWQALREVRSNGGPNTVVGTAELVDCAGVLVETDGPRVSAIGLEDVAIVVDGNEVLVTSMAGAQKVGTLDGAANQSGN